MARGLVQASLVAFLLLSGHAYAGKCADGQEADGINRAGGNGFCMALQPATPAKVEPRTPLLIVLHGDNGGKMIGSSYPALAKTIADEFSSPAVFMLRPGYQGDSGKSDGETRVQDDDYSPKNIEAMSFALSQLRDRFPERKLVVIGHSGGAAMAALLLAHYPKLVDAAVLAGCPCDVQPWRQWRQQSAGKRDGHWPNSLSPSDFVKQVPSQSVVVAVTGDKDTNTLPKFAEDYVAALRKNGVEHARFILAPGATHASVRQSRELIEGVRFAFEKVAGAN